MQVVGWDPRGVAAATENSRWMLNGSLDSRDLVPNDSSSRAGSERHHHRRRLRASAKRLWYEEIEYKNTGEALGAAASNRQAGLTSPPG